ncbi:MAG TPA: lysophospholipid acyltransferase family protein [Edaphocola sp.]|nr:lysophospholipid acyltransferase family protein [Edaphocola sp.]
MKYIYVTYALILFVGLFLLFLPFFFILSLFGGKGKKMIWGLVRFWALIWFPLVGIFNKNIYEHKPEKGKRYVVVINHQSFLDTPLILRVIPFFGRPLATAEYSKIPLFGFLYRQYAVLINRSNLRSKAEGFLRMNYILKNEASIIIFPEGKFNKTDLPIATFYDGAFKLAIDLNANILPILFLDAAKLWNPKSFWSLRPGNHRAVFLKEMNPNDFDNDLDKFKEEIHLIMSKKIVEYKKLKNR